ncbi:MAG: carboxylating nicotinate-nucleotide diphosphorylase [Planctomycetaceae bacterium]|nr:carboxylating nicotinate-nucleotide diphosphorylase [Planctomycetaceae bacterium]
MNRALISSTRPSPSLPAPVFGTAEAEAAARLIELALAEDLGSCGDITSQALLPTELKGNVQVTARASGIVSGLPIGPLVLREVDPSCRWEPLCPDGAHVDAGAAVAMLGGPVRSLLTAERTILNFLTHLSGVATLTRQYVDAVAGTGAVILDTRKTLPGWRLLEKYAVRCGGGTNHRMGLWDAVLIKDNHLAAVTEHSGTPLADILRLTRERVSAQTIVEIEVDSLEQLADALTGAPDLILLDNMSHDQLAEAVNLRNQSAPSVLLEASGGVDLSTVAAIAQSGVDRISIGRITHSAPALDLAFDWP